MKFFKKIFRIIFPDRRLEYEELGARSMYRHIINESTGVVWEIGDEEWNISEWLKYHKVGKIE